MTRDTVPIDPDAAAALVASPRWNSKVLLADSGCWTWTAWLNEYGYGKIRLGGRIAQAHRVALAAAMGRDLHPGLVVDHLCRNRACVRADHLREVTKRENTLAPGSESPTADHAARTHCPRGHILAGDNLVPSELAHGRRTCLTCRREQHALIREARLALGLTQREYGATFGYSRATAERLLGVS